jgi:hypothetical protein
MRLFAISLLSFAVLGLTVNTARADCDTNYVACMASCAGSLNPISGAICAYNCGVERTECKKNPDSAFMIEL